MLNFIDKILRTMNKVFRKQDFLEPSLSKKFLQSVLKAGVINFREPPQLCWGIFLK